MSPKKQENYASQKAYQFIKTNILSQTYLPGFQLREIHLSEELGLTRTPVREAIIKLESEGLVHTYPNRGAFVIKLTLAEVEDLFDVREALEIKASELAIRKANREQLDAIRKALEQHGQLIESSRDSNYRKPVLDFHEALIKLSHNQTLISIWQTMRSRLQLARVTSAMLAQRYRNAHEEHLQIHEHICAGETQQVRQLLIKHIAQARDNVFARWAS
ncbi:MAG: GntR family transcriptional regulator [Deltaproteobacteria bacterium]|nr:GntR family transcriptional regulator [Deltaproteobacteria bacterium]